MSETVLFFILSLAVLLFLAVLFFAVKRAQKRQKRSFQQSLAAIESINALIHSGDVLDREKMENALTQFDSSLKPYMNTAQVRTIRGLLLMTLQKQEDALEEFNRAIALKPDYEDGWSGRGIALVSLGRFQEAVEALDKAIELNPASSNARFNRAVAHASMGDREHVLSDLSKAVELDGRLKNTARKDERLRSLWDDEEFKRLVG